mgnify:CR=1 FL=1
MTIKLSLSVFAILMATNSAYSQQVMPLYEASKMPNAKPSAPPENLLSFPAGERTIRFITDVSSPELIAYLPDQKIATGMAVIVCPGGGYSGVAIDHEGHDIAKKLSENGIAGFVLKYRMPKTSLVENKEFVPLQDAQRAIQIVRENAKNWGINSRKIGIAGSSAGGHLASTAGTHYQKALIDNPKGTSLRPDFMILNYPVISFADSLTHYGSRFNLIGDMPLAELEKIMQEWQTSEQKLATLPVSPEKVAEYSNELKVTPDTPPVFITHSVDDDVVKVENAILFVAALQKNKVPVETFFYANGGHGYGMDNSASEVDWMENCIAWLLKMKD